MKKTSLSAVLAFAACGLGFTHAARAEVEFSNLGAGYRIRGAASVLGSDTPNPAFFTPQTLANEFTATFTGTMTTVDVPVLAAAPYAMTTPLIIVLYQNISGGNLPDTSTVQPLANFTVGSMPADRFGNYPLLSLSVTPAVTLEAGQSYWLGMLPANPDSFGLWSLSNDPESAPAATSNDGGVTYNPVVVTDDSFLGAEAFEIDADPAAAPEPST